MDSLDPVPASHDDLLHQVFDQSSAGFQVIDRDWRYVFVNQAVASQGKSSVENLLGKTMMEVYPGIENTPLFTNLRRSMEEGKTIRMENEFLYPDGSKGWFQLFIHPWSDGIMIFSVDITSRKQSEENLAMQVEELEKTVDSPDDLKKLSELKQALNKLRQPEVTVL